MIERIRIQGFKSIVDADLSLGALNVLVGANGAGKSNILEAIGLLGCAVSGRIGAEQFKHRGIRPGRPALYKSAFKDQKIRRVITLEAQTGTTHYRATLDNPIDQPENLWRYGNESYAFDGIKQGTRGPPGATLHRADGSRIEEARPEGTEGIIRLLRTLRPDLPGRAFLDALEDYAIYTPFTPILRGLLPDPSPRDPIGLSGGDLARALEDLRSRDKSIVASVEEQVLDLVDWASSIRGAKEEGPSGRALYFKDRYMTEGRNVLSAADVSEGALYVLFLLLLLHHPLAPNTFAVDNIDSALHPRLARSLVERVQHLLTEAGLARQLLVTTHNPLVLDALRLADERVRLLIVSRQKGTGMTTIRRIEHSEALERAISRGRTLSQLWVEGTLGGVPDLM
jgi:predicted ATPase